MNWKQIPGFSLYEANDAGLVRSVNYKRTGKKVILKPATGPDGYPQTMLLSDVGKYETHKIHWFVTLAFLGPRPSGCEVNHKNGNNQYNSTRNLKYVTRRKNMINTLTNNRTNKFVTGSEHGQAKLNEQQVREIRLHARSNGRYYGRKDLAVKYGISEAHVKDIVTNRRNLWKSA